VCGVQAAAAGSGGARVEHLSINRLQQRFPSSLPHRSSPCIVHWYFTLDRYFTVRTRETEGEGSVTENHDLVKITVSIGEARSLWSLRGFEDPKVPKCQTAVH